jgi:K+-transporting ATPase ATPase A chain
VVFGGVGAGLYGIVVFVILAVFIAGLMVGRTPEYLGKKIESYDVKMAMLAILILTFTILGFSALAIIKPFWKFQHLESRTSRIIASALRVRLVCRQ